MTGASEWLAGSAVPGVDQVGVVVRNTDQAVAQLSGVFRIGPQHVLDSEYSDGALRGQSTCYKLRLAFAKAGPVQIEAARQLVYTTAC